MGVLPGDIFHLTMGSTRNTFLTVSTAMLAMDRPSATWFIVSVTWLLRCFVASSINTIPEEAYSGFA